MCKEELEKIIKKLEYNEDFIKKYDINLRKEYSDSYFIIIKRKLKNKERSLEEKLVYNPSVSMDYDYKVDVCFKMRYTKGYISNSVSMYATKYVNDDDENYYHFRVRIPNTKSYEQTIIISEINIEDIIKYIDNTEWIITNTRSHENTLLPSNGYLCENCKCQLSKPAY